MPRRQAFKEYYTAGEVRKKLGITDGQLYNYVRYGHLQRIMPPGRKQGVYRRDEVDKFALELKAFLSGSDQVSLTKSGMSLSVTLVNVSRLTWSLPLRKAFSSSANLSTSSRL